MKILFLDIDGVLCVDYTHWINPSRAAILEEVIETTGCKIVLSSARRLDVHYLDSLRYCCRLGASTKWIDSIVDRTPDLSSRFGVLLYVPARDSEIIDWIDRHKSQIESFAVIDDEPLTVPNFVHTEFETGLNEYAKQRLIELLK